MSTSGIAQGDDGPLRPPQKRAARVFGVKRLGPFGVKRSTFIIGTDRRVQRVIASERNMEIHADEALGALSSASTG